MEGASPRQQQMHEGLLRLQPSGTASSKAAERHEAAPGGGRRWWDRRAQASETERH